MDIDDLKNQVKLNCNISDAKFWGYYSVCGLLLRLQELYRNEHSIMPWESIQKDKVSKWIAEREALWNQLENMDLQPLKIDTEIYDPFEINKINEILISNGLIYGGGYSVFNKPTFFLARLKNKEELYDHQVYYVGSELCRDLSASIAMLQGRCILIRLDSLKTLLWERLQDLKSRKSADSLKDFSLFGIEDVNLPSENLYSNVEAVSTKITDIFVLHELGEAYEGEHSDKWLMILCSNNDRLVELYMRGIKDLLADTSEMGPIKFIVEKREPSLFHFYTTFIDRIRKEIFPEITDAFRHFKLHGDWSIVEEARKTGYKRAKALRDNIIKLWDEGKKVNIRGFIEDYLKQI